MTVQAAFAATVVDEWVRGGVTDAVVAPGSRSTPLALALAARPDVRVHVHLDERSAGFYALGLGIATGRPAVVLTTSGTAAVELHPAVVEAHHAQVPLLACTADRPPELHDVGASQAIDQVHLFGRAVRWFAQPGVPDDAARATWRSLAARAVAEAAGASGEPGPVHLNLAFREPLVGEPDALPPARPGGGPWHTVVRTAPDPLDISDRVAGRRGIVVAGADAPGPLVVHGIAEAMGWPVLADARSGCRTPARATVGAFDALLRASAFAALHRPEVVLRLGAPLTSRVLNEWLAASGAEQVLVHPRHAWLDPDRTAATVAAAVTVARPVASDPEWLDGWTDAEHIAQATIASVLDKRPEPTEPAIARVLLDLLPGDATLLVSSSMPVRDLEWYAVPRDGVRVVANRGASGIDGVVSTALGVAAGTRGRRTFALLGDLAFLHDAGGLLTASTRGVDCTFVVVDNDGGGIFSFLPQAEVVAADRFETLFGTPHGLDLAQVAIAYGLPATQVDRIDELPAALDGGGVRVVIVRTERAANVAVHREINDAVAAALTAGRPRRGAPAA
jgi:2-succinyl-5-enolpyruvyl-6-hydroxy-3-cyclohexene-1-carboxylate synthase